VDSHIVCPRAGARNFRHCQGLSHETTAARDRPEDSVLIFVETTLSQIASSHSRSTARRNWGTEWIVTTFGRFTSPHPRVHCLELTEFVSQNKDSKSPRLTRLVTGDDSTIPWIYPVNEAKQSEFWVSSEKPDTNLR
jgi:hypothetical protein